MEMVFEILVVLAFLYLGSRYGSLALGVMSGLGLAVLVFAFGLTPGAPPTDVIYIIVAAVACASVFQAAGGMEYLIQLAEKMLRKHPERITFFAPLSTFLLTVLIGTGHVVYSLMPIIVDISLKKGIRPERPCAVASVASQLGITCSPIAAAVVAFTTISAANGFDVSITQVLMVTIPASLCGLIAASICSLRRGKDLSEDPEFQKRIADPSAREYVYGGMSTTLDRKISKEAKGSVFIFLTAIVIIILLAAFGFKRVKMNLVIQIVLLSCAALMVFLCKAKPSEAAAGSVFRNGMVAVVAIFGIAWMSDTVFSNHLDTIRGSLGGLAANFPWAISLVFFVVSILLNSQGAVVVSMLPLAYSLGIPGPILLGVLPSVYGYFFFPTYPSDIATVNFDRSGTTRIGKYLLNHSFMMPGLVSVCTATAVGLLLSKVIFG